MLSQITRNIKFTTHPATVDYSDLVPLITSAQAHRLETIAARSTTNRIIAEEAIAIIEEYGEGIFRDEEIIENTIAAAELLANGQLRDGLPDAHPAAFYREIARVMHRPTATATPADNFNSVAVCDRGDLLECSCHNQPRTLPRLRGTGQPACVHVMAVLLKEQADLAAEEMQFWAISPF